MQGDDREPEGMSNGSTSEVPDCDVIMCCVSSLPACLYVADLQNRRLTYLSPGIMNVYGRSAREFLAEGSLGLSYVHPEDLQRVLARAKRSWQGETSDHSGDQYRVIRPDGSVRWVLHHSTRVPDGNVQSPTIVGYVVDITDQKLSEQALAEAQAELERQVAARTTELSASEHRWRSLVATLPAVVMILNREGQILFINRELADGTTAEQLTGQSAFTFVLGAEADKLRKTIDRVLRDGQTAEETFDATSFLGRPVTYAAYLTPFTPPGQPAQVLIVANDVTAQRQADMELELYRQRLRKLAVELTMAEDRLRRRVAADLHDRIGQALGMIRIRLDEVRAACPEEQASTLLADSLCLLDQTLIDTRTMMFDLAPPVLYDLGLAAALDWLVEQYRSQHPQTSFRLEADGADGELAEGVLALLFRSASELLRNVVRHAGATEVLIRLGTQDGQRTIEVIDNGRGMPPDFEPQATPRRGFGLFSVRQNMEQLGGQVILDSRPGAGLRAMICVPLTMDGSRDHG